MLGRPTGSRGSGQSQNHQEGQEPERPNAGERIGGPEPERPNARERIGELTIARYRKDDGRELILYARAG
jgi:hypothetical protein